MGFIAVESRQQSATITGAINSASDEIGLRRIIKQAIKQLQSS